MPTILIVAGPNGAGKTTFANALFAAEAKGWPYLNADEIGREELPHLQPGEQAIGAGRLLLTRLDALVASGRDFGFETTLSSGLYARRIPTWRARGYRIELVYVRLASVEDSLARVGLRVARGGHGVPESDVRRRFARSLENLDRLYKPIVDAWEVWDSRDGDVRLGERSSR
ncbi:zeta toxin family protein [Caulobacter soli]|uniref:zeta toxin family protein n=1 Tax=Caulobacter soli TaxID=2708539 RepID=UPI0013EC4BE7|nr:zeta toxin family protein [Caulobacter soli]